MAGTHTRSHEVTIREKASPKMDWRWTGPGYRWECSCGDVGSWHADQVAAIKYRDHHYWDTAADETEEDASTHGGAA